jgi:hypothetical protein
MVIIDRFEPKIEGLRVQEQERRVTAFDCILSKEPLDETDPGYQKPQPQEAPDQSKPKEAVKKQTKKPAKEYNKPSEGARNTRGRGGKGRPVKRYNDDTDVQHDRKRKE